MHCYLYKKYVGEVPSGHIVDHINHIRYDNRLINLRENTRTGNMHNKSKKKDASSKYYGVSWHQRSERSEASVKKDHVDYKIGRFQEELEAARSYSKKASELYGEFAITSMCLRFHDLYCCGFSQYLPLFRYPHCLSVTEFFISNRESTPH